MAKKHPLFRFTIGDVLLQFRKRERVITTLRRLYPGRWTYSHQDGTWSHEDGWEVRRVAALAPRFDGDDDSFRLRYYRVDTGERLYGLPGEGKPC